MSAVVDVDVHTSTRVPFAMLRLWTQSCIILRRPVFGDSMRKRTPPPFDENLVQRNIQRYAKRLLRQSRGKSKAAAANLLFRQDISRKHF